MDNFHEGNEDMDFRDMPSPSLLDWELSILRECTKEALRMSWAEAERLQDENTAFENRIAELRHKIEKIEAGDSEKSQKETDFVKTFSLYAKFCNSDKNETHDQYSSNEGQKLRHSFPQGLIPNGESLIHDQLCRRHSDTKVLEKHQDLKNYRNLAIQNQKRYVLTTNLNEKLFSHDNKPSSKENDDDSSETGDIDEQRTESELMDSLAQLEQSTKIETQDLEKQISERERGIIALEETTRRQEENVHKLRKELEISSSRTEQEIKCIGEELELSYGRIKDLEMKDRKLDMLLLKLTSDLRGKGITPCSQNTVILSELEPDNLGAPQSDETSLFASAEAVSLRSLSSL